MKSYFFSRHFQAYHNIRQIWNRYRYLLFFIIGMLTGILCVMFFTKGKILEDSTSNDFYQFNIYNASYKNAVSNLNINHMQLWQNVVSTRFRDFAIIMILGFTRYYEIWLSIYLLFEGVLSGLLAGMALASWGGIGILVFAGSLLPHYIIYIAAVMLMLHFFQKKNYNIKNTAATIGFVIILVIVGTFVEAFINPYLQKWILNQISNLI